MEIDKAVVLSGTNVNMIALKAGPSPLPKSSVKLYKANAALLFLGAFALIKMDLTLESGNVIIIPVKIFTKIKRGEFTIGPACNKRDKEIRLEKSRSLQI